MNEIRASIELIRRHEGYRKYPYKDTVNKLTIGYGTNLEDRGLSVKEAVALMETDVYRLGEALDEQFFFQGLSDARKAVIIDMAYNLGLKGLYGFKRMIRALEEKNYGLAAKEMMDSKWAGQVRVRSVELSQIMLTDEIPEAVAKLL